MAMPSPGIYRMRAIRGKVSQATGAVEDAAARVAQKATRKPLLTLGFAVGVGIAIGGLLAWRRILNSSVGKGAAAFQSAGERAEEFLDDWSE